MAVIQKNIVVPDELLPKIMSGEIDIMGLAKNARDKRVVKHLDTFDLKDARSSTAVAVVIIGAGIVAVAGIGYSVYRVVGKIKVKRFKKALNEYVEAVKCKSLTLEIIDELLSALDKLKGNLRKKILIEFSSDEISALIECLCNHTQTLAAANNFNLEFKPTKNEQDDILLRLHNSLVRQKGIFELIS